MGITVFVPGSPAPQGSKTHVGKGVMVESSKAVKPWREDVRATVRSAMGPGLLYPQGEPVWARLEFVMPRPLSAPKRSTPPAVKKADLDKLVRAVFDALTSAGVWHDDKQVVEVHASKRLAELGETPGCLIEVRAAAGGDLLEEAA